MSWAVLSARSFTATDVFSLKGPALGSISTERPVYLCTLSNETNNIIIENCELLVDTGNTACDLLLSFKDARKFQLVPSTVSMGVDGLTGGTRIVKMLPALLLTFALRGPDGDIVEKIASLDVFVKQDELKAFQASKDISLSEITSVIKGRVPVNDPSPIRHLRHGSANLGRSGCKKLKLRYDSESDEISFLENADEWAEI